MPTFLSNFSTIKSLNEHYENLNRNRVSDWASPRIEFVVVKTAGFSKQHSKKLVGFARDGHDLVVWNGSANISATGLALDCPDHAVVPKTASYETGTLFRHPVNTLKFDAELAELDEFDQSCRDNDRVVPPLALLDPVLVGDCPAVRGAKRRLKAVRDRARAVARQRWETSTEERAAILERFEPAPLDAATTLNSYAHLSGLLAPANGPLGVSNELPPVPAISSIGNAEALARFQAQGQVFQLKLCVVCRRASWTLGKAEKAVGNNFRHPGGVAGPTYTTCNKRGSAGVSLLYFDRDDACSLDCDGEKITGIIYGWYATLETNVVGLDAMKESIRRFLVGLDHPQAAWLQSVVDKPDAKGLTRHLVDCLGPEVYRSHVKHNISDEVRAAIASSAKGSSPGPTGIPYEMYKGCSSLFVEALVNVFNAIWARERLPPSQAMANVRLLFENKPGSSPSSLASWRPISLHETDYKLMTKILEKAYDLVDHDWILDSYEAFGAPPRFLSLLRTLYDGSTLRARYNVNGFQTSGIELRCGLPQGDPLSCASWIVSFQPFLDAIVRRAICLQLPSPISTTRSDILTTLAFADDSTLVVESLDLAFPRLARLAEDWRVATNGRLNAGKTVATAIGDRAKEAALAGQVRWSEDEGFVKWAGFPFAPRGDRELSYSFLRASLTGRLERANGAAARDPRSRALYINTFVLSRSLHILSLGPPPPSFLDELERAIVNFVWNGKYHPVRKGVLFAPVAKGGVGLLNPKEIVRANAARFMDRLIRGEEVIWLDLARDALGRAAGIEWELPRDLFRGVERVSFRNPLSLLVPASPLPDDQVWRSTLSHARTVPISIATGDLRLEELLALPPALLSDSPLSVDSTLRSVGAVAELHYRSRPTTLPLLEIGLYTLSPNVKTKKVVEWRRIVAASPSLSILLPPTAQPYSPLPLPSSPRPSTWSFASLPPPFTASDLRRQLANKTPPTPPASTLDLPTLDASGQAKLWSWIQARPATAREADTHWRILHGVIMTRARMQRVGRALADSLSDAFTSDNFSPTWLLLGLPSLLPLVENEIRPRLRIRPEKASTTSLAPTLLATIVLRRIKNRLS
ncbi:hypothetical protein JCM10212_000492 [Sporobolomyces blumeae]